jgi:hypothetical protein
MSEIVVVYVCVRCLTPAGEGGSCTYCGGARVACKIGDEGDPSRRPLMSGSGEVLTRAPVWWLQRTVPELMELLED